MRDVLAAVLMVNATALLILLAVDTRPTGECCVFGPVVNVANPIYWAISASNIGLGYWLGKRKAKSQQESAS